MNWKYRLLISLLFWLGFGAACSMMLGHAHLEPGRESTMLWKLWLGLPLCLVIGVVQAASADLFGLWPFCTLAVLVVAHGWYWFTVRNTIVWLTLYWLQLFVTVTGAWGFHQFVRSFDD